MQLQLRLFMKLNELERIGLLFCSNGVLLSKVKYISRGAISIGEEIPCLKAPMFFQYLLLSLGRAFQSS